MVNRVPHPDMRSRAVSFRSILGLNRNVAVLAASLFGLALGEELWQAYIPAYLTALGASGLIVGLFGSCKDLLDGVYQYPGGWLADRIGRHRALLLFTALAMAGYATYAIARSWPFVFVGLLGVMAWKSGAFPLTFAVIGDSLPRERRATAFSVQSILVRVPRVIGAPIGGLLIASLGIIAGIRAALLVTLLLALGVLAVQRYGYRELAWPIAKTPGKSVCASRFPGKFPCTGAPGAAFAWPMWTNLPSHHLAWPCCRSVREIRSWARVMQPGRSSSKRAGTAAT